MTRATAAESAARSAPDSAAVARVGAEHLERVREASSRFFEAEARGIADACLALASRFRVGGRLLVLAAGPAASDGDHVAVEFVHPVLVGKRALPALALGADLDRLRTLARPEDIALAVAPIAIDPALSDALQVARDRGLLTIGLYGRGGPNPTPGLHHAFAIPSDDPFVVQEVQETCYHILWELVHVFLESGRGAA